MSVGFFGGDTFLPTEGRGGSGLHRLAEKLNSESENSTKFDNSVELFKQLS